MKKRDESHPGQKTLWPDEMPDYHPILTGKQWQIDRLRSAHIGKGGWLEQVKKKREDDERV